MTKNDSALSLANCVRFLSIDSVERANSGHPGMPMGMADVATILFTEFLKFDAKKPNWLDRDRFILSAGHGSMLLYSLLCLTGYEDISIDDLKNFRQLHAKCAGHPEFGHLAGIETTTGPLGQGLANAVGMALGERMLAARIGEDLINHKTYVIAGDGCLMEGISQEAISVAGHLGLNKLVLLWDDNSISIDGHTSIATSENMKMRFEACNWNVIEIDGHNFEQIRSALNAAQTSDKPVMIACKTTIGFGSPSKAGTEKCHGSPLGADEIAKVRAGLNWPHAAFEIPQDLNEKWLAAGARSAAVRKNWEEKFAKLDKSKSGELTRILNKELPQDFAQKIAAFKEKLFAEKPNQATRKSSQISLEFLTGELSELIGGSADLTESVLTKTSHTKSISKNNFAGRYIHYGVREHAMGAIMNGLALHSKFIPFGGTFAVFSDYMKPAIRLAALMKQQVIYILTHDSIGLGEDGPTHQPIEHLAMLRGVPNLNVFRPADARETIECFEIALNSKETPSAMFLTRQNLPFLPVEFKKENSCEFGAYTVLESENPKVVLLATGSEVLIAIETQEKLKAHGISARVVSVPCFELFEKQSDSYKKQILGDSSVLKVAIEAAISQGWHQFIGADGIFIGMNDFGASAKASDLFKHFGITSDVACEKIINKLKA
ncbi:MAG: transketolase [Rickettsiales bacterium]|nr:transketolase [Rickettsiales bacterium]